MEKHILAVIQIHPMSHADLFPHTGLGDNSYMVPITPCSWRETDQRRGSAWMNCSLSLVQLFSGTMTDTHLSPVHSLSFRATTNAVVMQPLLLLNLHPNTKWAICKPNAGFLLLFQRVKQDLSYNHRCKRRERWPEKLNSYYNISFW